MTTAIEYALVAGASYISTRDDVNQFPIPQGWEKVVSPRIIKGVSFALLCEQPSCHAVRALN